MSMNGGNRIPLDPMKYEVSVDWSDDDEYGGELDIRRLRDFIAMLPVLVAMLDVGEVITIKRVE